MQHTAIEVVRLPRDVRRYTDTIDGQQVTVKCYPTGARRKVIKLRNDTLDGTSFDNLGPLGLKAIEAIKARRDRSLRKPAKRHEAGPGRQVVLGGRGLRQADWSFSNDRWTVFLAPVKPMAERERDVVSTDPMWAWRDWRPHTSSDPSEPAEYLKLVWISVRKKRGRGYTPRRVWCDVASLPPLRGPDRVRTHRPNWTDLEPHFLGVPKPAQRKRDRYGAPLPSGVIPVSGAQLLLWARGKWRTEPKPEPERFTYEAPAGVDYLTWLHTSKNGTAQCPGKGRCSCQHGQAQVA